MQLARNLTVALALLITAITLTNNAHAASKCYTERRAYSKAGSTERYWEKQLARLERLVDSNERKQARAILKVDASLARARAKLGELKDRRVGDWLFGNGISLEYAINRQEAVINSLNARKRSINKSYDAFYARAAKRKADINATLLTASDAFSKATATLKACLDAAAA